MSAWRAVHRRRSRRPRALPSVLRSRLTADTRIDKRVRDVGARIEKNHDSSEQQREEFGHLIVAIEHAIDQLKAEPRPAEDHLDDQRIAEERTQLDRGD